MLFRSLEKKEKSKREFSWRGRQGSDSAWAIDYVKGFGFYPKCSEKLINGSMQKNDFKFNTLKYHLIVVWRKD